MRPHADFTGLRDADDIPHPRRTRIRRPDGTLTPEEAADRDRFLTQVLRTTESE